MTTTPFSLLEDLQGELNRTTALIHINNVSLTATTEPAARKAVLDDLALLFTQAAGLREGIEAEHRFALEKRVARATAQAAEQAAETAITIDAAYGWLPEGERGL